jgi:hypothetical protein
MEHSGELLMSGDTSRGHRPVLLLHSLNKKMQWRRHPMRSAALMSFAVHGMRLCHPSARSPGLLNLYRSG